MKDRPILFSGPMVRALLDGSKTQTRRALRDQVCAPGVMQMAGPGYAEIVNEYGVHIPGFSCPYGQPGDRLWVRETWAPHPDFPETVRRGVYRADPECKYDVERWRPSIHMPRWASRIVLEVVSVRVERLNDCSKKDAIAEGIHRYEHIWRDAEYPLDDVAYEPVKGWPTRYSCPIQAYQALWESINGAGSWDANPWVWVVEFKRMAP